MAEVRVRLQCGGLQLEYQGRREGYESSLVPLLGVLRRCAPVVAAAARPAPLEEPTDAAPILVRPGYEPPSDHFGTFQRQLAVEDEDQAQLVAAYAFFLWNYEKREVFTEDEVAGCFAAHGRVQPPDPAEIYGDLLTQRVLSPGADRNTWRLTSKGRDYVRHHLLSA